MKKDNSELRKWLIQAAYMEGLKDGVIDGFKNGGEQVLTKSTKASPKKKGECKVIPLNPS